MKSSSRDSVTQGLAIAAAPVFSLEGGVYLAIGQIAVVEADCKIRPTLQSDNRLITDTYQLWVRVR